VADRSDAADVEPPPEAEPDHQDRPHRDADRNQAGHQDHPGADQSQAGHQERRWAPCVSGALGGGPGTDPERHPDHPDVADTRRNHPGHQGAGRWDARAESSQGHPGLQTQSGPAAEAPDAAEGHCRPAADRSAA
jgi:hypothetical protein